jgi:hypothetical protein
MVNARTHTPRAACSATFAACCFVLGACQEVEPELPATYPVTGEVRYSDGKLLAQGVVQFHSEENSSLNVSAPIVDGRFALVTAFDRATRPGAIPGRYRVSVTPAFDVVPQTIELHDRYEVLARPTEVPIRLESVAANRSP